VAAPTAREEREDLLLIPALLAELPEVEREVVVLRFLRNSVSIRSPPGRLLADARVAAAAPGHRPHAPPAPAQLIDLLNAQGLIHTAITHPGRPTHRDTSQTDH
jgi:hypothetical protein